jgi:hypothetical protein
MDEDLAGSNLIFLISQPRAGSTLTQRILGQHPEIYTLSEPWLMLHPFYALRPDQCVTNYDAKLAYEGTSDFLQNFQEKEEVYFEGVRKMYSYLYDCALQQAGKYYFLDKTPRYYNIIPELYCTFPKAKFIILLRNPLAVLCSIINTWIKDNWLLLSQCKNDLLVAPNLLLNGIKLLDKQCLVLKYENLLIDSDSEVERLCNWLNIDLHSEMINYGLGADSQWKLGDQNAIYQKAKPDPNHLDKWVLSLESPQIWRLANEYLKFLGQETLENMGYSYHQLQDTLNSHSHSSFNLISTFSLELLLKDRDDYKKIEYEYYLLKLIESLKIRGIGGTISYVKSRF